MCRACFLLRGCSEEERVLGRWGQQEPSSVPRKKHYQEQGPMRSRGSPAGGGQGNPSPQNLSLIEVGAPPTQAARIRSWLTAPG